MAFLNYLPLLCFSITFIYADPVPAQNQSLPNVTIYYESLCPDSGRLMTELASQYDALIKPYFNLTLVPYGRANITTETPFTMVCSHGASECEGDKVHACVLKQSSLDMGTMIKFINCTMNPEVNSNKGSSNQFNITQCGQFLNTSSQLMNEVLDCSKKDAVQNYLFDYRSLTKLLYQHIPDVGIPAVVFNNDFNLTKSKEATNNLKESLCTNISGNKPAVCAGGSHDHHGGGAAYVSGSLVLSTFFIIAVHFAK